MKTLSANGDRYITLLSGLTIRGYEGDFSNPAEDLQLLDSAIAEVAGFSEEQFIELLQLANIHHGARPRCALNGRGSGKRSSGCTPLCKRWS